MRMQAGGSAGQQRVGGWAALYVALAYVVAMPYFLVLVKYPALTDPVEKTSVLVGHHGSLQAIYLLTYVILGVALAVLGLSLYHRVKDEAPVLGRVAAVVGIIWALVLVASGLIFNAGVAAVVDLHGTDPARAVAIWQAVEPVAQGLGGAGGELLGGLWVLLVSAAALRAGRLPKSLNWLGIALGAAGIISIVPALRDLAYGFGMLQIVWCVWLGIVMLRVKPRAVASPVAISPTGA